MFFDAHGRLRSLLAAWTSLAPQDAFAQASGGRSWFRIDDLLQLSALIDAPARLRVKRKHVK